VTLWPWPLTFCPNINCWARYHDTSMVPTHPLAVDKWVVSCHQMAAITSQLWRCLMNAYEVKAFVVCLQCKTVWSIPECFRSELLRMGRYTNLCNFTLSWWDIPVPSLAILVSAGLVYCTDRQTEWQTWMITILTWLLPVWVTKIIVGWESSLSAYRIVRWPCSVCRNRVGHNSL